MIQTFPSSFVSADDAADSFLGLLSQQDAKAVIGDYLRIMWELLEGSIFRMGNEGLPCRGYYVGLRGDSTVGIRISFGDLAEEL